MTAPLFGVLVNLVSGALVNHCSHDSMIDGHNPVLVNSSEIL